MKYKWKSVFFNEDASHKHISVDTWSADLTDQLTKFVQISKKIDINPIKNLESNGVLTTVLEKLRRKPGKSPSKMRNIIWKVFFFPRKMLPMKTILCTLRVRSDRPSYKILHKVRKKLAKILSRNLETNALLSTVLENICSKTWNFPLKYEIQWEKCFFFKQDAAHKNNPVVT